jgi:hypothetical protein
MLRPVSSGAYPEFLVDARSSPPVVLRYPACREKFAARRARQQMLQGLRLIPSTLLHCLHDTRLESANLAFDGLPIEGFPCRALVQNCTSLRRHLLTLLGRLAKFSRDGRPGGSLPAFAPGSLSVSAPLRLGICFLLHPLPAPPSSRLAAELPFRERFGLTMFRMRNRNGLGPSSYTGGLHAHDG